MGVTTGVGRGPARSRAMSALLGDQETVLELLFGADRYGGHMRQLIGRFMVPTAIGVAAAVIAAGDVVSNERRVVVLGALVLCLMLLILTLRLPVDRVTTAFVVGLGFVGCGATVACIWAVGPSFGVAASAVSGFCCLAAVMLTRRGLLLVGSEMLIGYALIVTFVDGYPRPAAQVLACATFALVSASVVRWAVGQIEVLADDLATANARLREYVAPQVAAAVVSATDLEPHRRKIAVWFCDLRGFTSFTVGAEPEEVVDVLADYYAAVGDLASTARATIGAFAGDGIHGYFGDPIPRDDAAAAAIDFALALRPRLNELCTRWTASGFALGYGIGIAYGYATLGTVGYEGRRDYTALGSVVNLAARLCGEAANGEVLLDARTLDAAGAPMDGISSRELSLKGIAGPVVAYSFAGTST